MNVVKIKDIANVSSGTYQKEILDGDFLYLQIKDFTSSHLDKGELNPTIPHTGSTAKHLLMNKDLLFAAKGTSNFCVLYNNRLGQAIASTSFFIIRLTVASILPEFLCWYINLPQVIKKLRSKAVGSFTPSITKDILMNLSVNIPSLPAQQRIVNLNQLRKKEHELQVKLTEKKEQVYNQVLMNILKSNQ